MPARTQKVVFARINRRRPVGEDTIAARSFLDDMSALAESHETTYVEPATRGHPARSWAAGDLRIVRWQPSLAGREVFASLDDYRTTGLSFMIGILGYTSAQQRRVFDEEHWSWISSRVEETDTARDDTISPFVVDLREGDRWVGFSPAARLGPKAFAIGFERVLNSAVLAGGVIPTEWEVDLVVSRNRVDEWIRVHPLVHMLRRTIKFTNPGRDLDSDRAEMRALAARRKTEEFKAPSNGVLNVRSDTFREKLNGVETGDIELYLKSRGSRGAGDAIFRSNDSADSVSVDDFGGDLVRGTEIVMGSLIRYVTEKEIDRD